MPSPEYSEESYDEASEVARDLSEFRVPRLWREWERGLGDERARGSGFNPQHPHKPDMMVPACNLSTEAVEAGG